MNQKNIFIAIAIGMLLLFVLKVEPTLGQAKNLNQKNIIAEVPACSYPKTYYDSVASFNKQPVITGRIIFLGNSITQRANWQELLHNPTVINRGIGGDATCGVLDRLDDVIKRKPSKLFILIGINDMQRDLANSRPINMTRISENYELILQRVKAGTPDTKIYVESVLPTNVYLRQHYGKGKPPEFSEALNAGVITLNRKLKKLAEDYECTWVNIHDQFTDDKGELIADYTTDGIHPNTAGYNHLISYLRSKCYYQ